MVKYGFTPYIVNLNISCVMCKCDKCQQHEAKNGSCIAHSFLGFVGKFLEILTSILIIIYNLHIIFPLYWSKIYRYYRHTAFRINIWTHPLTPMWVQLNLIELNVLLFFKLTKDFLFLPLQYVTIRSCRLTEKIYCHLKKARKNRPPLLFFYCFCGA